MSDELKNAMGSRVIHEIRSNGRERAETNRNNEPIKIQNRNLSLEWLEGVLEFR